MSDIRTEQTDLVDAIDNLMERVAQRTATLTAAAVLAGLSQQTGGVAEGAADRPGAAEPNRGRSAAPAARGGNVTPLRGGGDDKRATDAQIARLGNIRATEKLWRIINDVTRGAANDFEDLSFDEAQTALDTFYEGSGGQKPASYGGRRR